MKIGQIEKKVKKLRDEKNEEKYVGKLYDLLEIRDQTKKQLATVEKKIKAFKKSPEKFVDENEDLWEE